MEVRKDKNMENTEFIERLVETVTEEVTESEEI